MSKPISSFHATLIAIMGFAMWVLGDTCNKIASQNSIPPYETLGVIGLVGVLSIASYAWRQGKLKSLRPHNWRQQLIRAGFATSSILINIIAVKHLPLTVFYVIIFLSPMIVTVLAALFLKETLSLPKIIAILTGFIGVVYAINPWNQNGSGDMIGYIAVTVGVSVFALNQVWSRVMSQSETMISMAFMTATVSAVIGLVPSIIHFERLSPFVFSIIMGAGIFNLLGNIMNFLALRHVNAATVSQFHYTQIIMGAIMGYLIWRDVPSLHLIIGAVIIIASGLFIVMQARKEEPIQMNSI